jgi:tetratricopeptide (TPR) repeat protein
MAIVIIAWAAFLPYMFRMAVVIWCGLRGNRLSLRGDYAGALAAYDKGLKYFKAHVGLLYGRGVALRKMGRDEEALTCYREVIDHHPGHYRSWYNIGTILRDRGDMGQAERAFLKAIDIRPSYTRAHANLAILYDKLGERDKAVEYYSNYLTYGGNDPLLRNRARQLGAKEND